MCVCVEVREGTIDIQDEVLGASHSDFEWTYVLPASCMLQDKGDAMKMVMFVEGIDNPTAEEVRPRLRVDGLEKEPGA